MTVHSPPPSFPQKKFWPCLVAVNEAQLTPGISLDCAALSTPDGVQICTRIKFQSLTLGRSFRFCILICLCRLFFGICTAATMHVPSCVAYLIAVGMTLMESFQTRGRGVVHEVALRRMFLSPLLCPK